MGGQENKRKTANGTLKKELDYLASILRYDFCLISFAIFFFVIWFLHVKAGVYWFTCSWSNFWLGYISVTISCLLKYENQSMFINYKILVLCLKHESMCVYTCVYMCMSLCVHTCELVCTVYVNMKTMLLTSMKEWPYLPYHLLGRWALGNSIFHWVHLGCGYLCISWNTE